MGQPVTVVQKQTSRDDVIRFEINRSLTGMEALRYPAGKEIEGHRPPDELARRLLAHPGVEAVHIYSNTITVDLGAGVLPADLAEEIGGLFTYYREGVEVAVPTAPGEEADAAE
jgi:hypothetical protein